MATWDKKAGSSKYLACFVHLWTHRWHLMQVPGIVFHKRMYVFGIGDFQSAAVDIRKNFVQRFDYEIGVSAWNYSAFSEHCAVRFAALYVAFIKAFVECERTVETVRCFIDFAFESARPELHYFLPFTLCIFIARTLLESPNSVMNPPASWWSYSSPVVKLASDSL